MAQVAQINPRLLAWARETAGLSPEEAAAKLGLKSTARATAAEKLLQAETGARPVSPGMLEKAAATYRRPLITFYLPQPPARGDRGDRGDRPGGPRPFGRAGFTDGPRGFGGTDDRPVGERAEQRGEWAERAERLRRARRAGPGERFGRDADDRAPGGRDADDITES